MSEYQTSFVPLAPIQLVSPNGRVKGYGLGSTTDAQRGTAIAAAVTAAASGDLIEVFADAAVTSNLAKNGVDWWFAPGVTISRTNGFIFDDGNTAMTFSVGGFGSFHATEAGTGSGVVSVTHALSVITLRGKRCEVTAVDEHSSAVFVGDGGLIVECDEIVCNGFDYCVWWTGGSDWFIKCKKLTSSSTSSHPIFITGTATTGKFWLWAELIECTGSTLGAIACDAAAATTTAWIFANEIRAHSANASNPVIRVGEGKLYVTCQKLASDSGCPLLVAGGVLYLTAQKIEAELTATLSGGTLYGQVDLWIDSGASDELLTVSGGTHYLRLLSVERTSAGSGFEVTAGTLNLLEGKISTQAGSNDLVRSGGTLNVGPAVVYDTTKTSGTITLLPFYGATPTAAGLALLDDADAAAQRTTLGLGTLATQSGTFSGTSSGTNTGDETAAGVLAKLLTVDGASSGLDADLLDGNSSAAFALLSHVHSTADLTSGTLGVARGGTGIATLATGRIPYGNGTGALQSSAGLVFDGTYLSAYSSPNYVSIAIGLIMSGYSAVYADGFSLLFGLGCNVLALHSYTVERLALSSTGGVFNESGADFDWRFEGDTDANCFTVDAGNDSVGVGVALGSHVASAKFQVHSTTKASIPAPRMTTTQRDLIGTPVEGDLVYNLTTHQLEDYDGSAWAAV